MSVDLFKLSYTVICKVTEEEEAFIHECFKFGDTGSYRITKEGLKEAIQRSRAKGIKATNLVRRIKEELAKEEDGFDVQIF